MLTRQSEILHSPDSPPGGTEALRSTEYDDIGRGYRDFRVPDPRIAAQLHAALGDAACILNVGAGSGSYEPAGREVVALEPSRVMIDQRGAGLAPVVQGRAEYLPFPDKSFDAVLGVLTLHHWQDQATGLSEVVRVARDRVILLSWVGYANRFWLFDYFPEMEALDNDIFPTVDWIEAATGCAVEEFTLPVPADCSDGFLCAYWRRPEAYLDVGVRGAISTFASLDNVEARLQQLRHDLDSGTWRERHAGLLQKEYMDYGYRVLLLTSSA